MRYHPHTLVQRYRACDVDTHINSLAQSINAPDILQWEGHARDGEAEAGHGLHYQGQIED